MNWSDWLALPGYGVILYILCSALAELVKKGIYPVIEKAWLNLVFHGNIRGEKKLRK